jgi:hypothetical protein
VPLTVQTASVNDTKATGSPDEAVAFRANGSSLKVLSANGSNVITCLAGAMKKVWLISGAGLYSALPG